MNFFNVQDLHIKLAEFNLQGVSLSLDQGDYLTIIGPTGAGKTIFLESIVGFWRPDRGRIMLNGKDITDEPPEKRHIGIVYQDYALLPHMTVHDNIAYGLKKFKPRNMDKEILEIAESLNIDHLLHRKPTTLSGGEQQRVALARVLIVKPKLILMDEPFSALDQKTRRHARILMKKAVRERSATVIHITHDLDDAWALADKLAVFNKGKLVQFGPIDTVFSRPKSRFVAEFVGAEFFDGTVTACDGCSSSVDLGGICLTSQDRTGKGEKVGVAVRYENISVSSRRPSNDSGLNILEGVVEHIFPEGPSSIIDLKINGIKINALISNKKISALKIQQGETLYAMIEKEHVNIVST